MPLSLIVEVAFDTDPGQTEHDAVLADGPAAYWRLGETSGTVAADESGNGRTGTYVGTPTLGATGLLDPFDMDKAVTFPGTAGTRVDAGNPVGLQLASGTVEAWFKTTTPGASYRALVVKQLAWGVFVKDGVLITYDFTTGQDRSTGINVADGLVHHVVVVFDSGVAGGTLVYLDGVLVLTTQITVSNQTQNLGIGVSANGVGVWIQEIAATLDEVAVYPAKLSAERIAYHYESRLVRVTPTWTDVTQYMRGLQVRTGRPNEFSNFEPGVTSVRLLNTDRRFDPLYAAGPYYPNLIPMRQLRVRASFNAVTYDLFRGYIEKWPQAWQVNKYGEVQVEAVDGLAVLRNTRVVLTGVPAESSGTRIARILDAAGFPRSMRSIDTGQSTVQGGDFDGDALALISTVNESELGFAYIDAGTFVFRDRHRRIKATVPLATFGDGGGTELPYTAIGGDFDIVDVRNDIQLTRLGGSQFIAQDPPSIRKNLKRTFEKTTLLLTTDNDVRAMAEYLLSRYKDPFLRFGMIELAPEADAALIYPVVLAAALSNRYTVKKTPFAIGPAISADQYTEGIEFTWTPERKLAAKLSLSPADTFAYWILGDSTAGVLGSTTRLAF